MGCYMSNLKRLPTDMVVRARMWEEEKAITPVSDGFNGGLTYILMSINQHLKTKKMP